MGIPPSPSRFSRPLLLTWRQDLWLWLSRRIGRLLLMGTATVSTLAVFAIFAFIIYESGQFLFGAAAGVEAAAEPTHAATSSEAEDAIAHGPEAEASGPVEVVSRGAQRGGRRLKEIFGSSRWYPTHDPPEFGMGSMIFGSLAVTFGAMLLAVPLGIMAAVVLSDIVPFRVRQFIKPVVELLAAIPSVALGFFAIKVIAPWLTTHLGLASGANALNASVVLAIMAIPTIMSVAEDALTSLGRDLREASYSLGATRTETILRVVIPAAHSGILAAVVLGMMRAVGETMVVWMAAGNANNFPTPWYDVQAVLMSFADAVRTMTGTIAGEMGETAAGSVHRSALFAVGSVLLLFTFLLNLATEYLGGRFRRTMGHVDLAPSESPCEKCIACYVLKATRSAWAALRYAMAFVPHVLLFVWDEATGLLFSLLGRGLRLRLRLAIDRCFTALGFVSISVIAGALVVVLGPIFYRGVGAFLFRETVEHRLFLLDEFRRGDVAAVEAEYAACLAAREPVYEMLDRFAWLDSDLAGDPAAPAAAQAIDKAAMIEKGELLADQTVEVLETKLSEPRERLTEIQIRIGQLAIEGRQDDDLERQRATLQREVQALEERFSTAKLAANRVRRALTKACRAETPEAAMASLDKAVAAAEGDVLQGTPADEMLTWVESLRLEIAEAGPRSERDLAHAAVDREKRQEYRRLYCEIRNLITCQGGTGGILGPRLREGIGHLPPEVKYGATHWSMVLEYNRRLQFATVWTPQIGPDGEVLCNVKTRVPRREQIAGTPLEPMGEMLDYVDRHLEEMTHPRWTFYGRYFIDPSTAGHFLGGIGPEVLGTLLITFLAVVLAMPCGVITAAYLVETARSGPLTRVLRMCINTLAGVPSIVFGLFGLAVIVRFMTGGPCVLAAALTLAVLILPIIIRASEEAIRAVPQTYREASLGLGAGPVRCFMTVTLPAALPGILTGTILAMSRAAGETAPLLFTGAVATGGFLSFSDGLFGPLWQQTPVLSYSAYDIAVGDRIADLVPYNQYGLVATLIGLVLLMNFGAILLRGRISARLRGS